MKMKTKSIIIGLGIILVSSTAYAVGSTPGDINDPIVTKSYVDQKFAELNTKVDNVESATYQIVNLSQGSQLVGAQGTEIIVRDGSAVVVGSPAGGLQNMTEGTDLVGGTSVPKYHLLIVPREDGRGILANTDLTLMVRGGYSVIQ